MLKLMKYELRKARTAYGILLAAFIALQAYFMISLHADSEGNIIASALLLFVAAYVTAIVVFVMGITNFSNELKQKSSYLIFMTPNSALKIMLAKMLFAILSATVFGGGIAALGLWDIGMLAEHYGEYLPIYELFKEFLAQTGADLNEIYLLIGFALADVFLSLMCALVVAYLAVALSATVLQQKKARGIITAVIYFAILTGLEKLSGLYIDPDAVLSSITDLTYALIPMCIQNTVVVIACLFGSAWLLEKKVSL